MGRSSSGNRLPPEEKGPEGSVFILKYSTELPCSGPNQMDEMWGRLQLYCWPLARVFVAMGTTAKKLY